MEMDDKSNRAGTLGHQSLISNYRMISLMSVAAKLFNRLLLDRIRPHIEPVLRNNQALGAVEARLIRSVSCEEIFEGAQDKQSTRCNFRRLQKTIRLVGQR